MKTINVPMGDQEHLDLRHLCLDKGVTVGSFVKQAIDEKLASLAAQEALKNGTAEEV